MLSRSLINKLRLSTFVLLIFLVVPPSILQGELNSQKKFDPETATVFDDAVLVHRTALVSFEADIELSVQINRGPIERKLKRQTAIRFDGAGRWQLTRKDPLEGDQWDVFALGSGSKKLYLRKNLAPFKFAADPLEVDQWLKTSLLDFYRLVEEKRLSLLEGEASQNAEQKEMLGQAVRCYKWKQEAADESINATDLCLTEEKGVILAGTFREYTVDQAEVHPIATLVEAKLIIQKIGAEVTPVAAPSLEGEKR
jgi:hypothetical protein